LDEIVDAERENEDRLRARLPGAGLERRVGAREDHERVQVRAISKDGREVIGPPFAIVSPGVQD